ncbi:hypothetical protein LSH36_115g01043 [Paralvinella palmiformis]|uniref:Mab-21-like HhH/H2TH-like domain-containing protein n=2 Tax=Paralvinella palmiformis TaxID=53620 RepID=A0AAD9NAJ0_9ANNE|nr:hypothetical protein LSH36_115g01043 [Paralvinella palmiformis]
MASGGRTDKEIYNNFILSIRDSLKSRNIIDRVEYAGSRYKGTHVDASDFDNLFIKRDQTIIAELSPYPSYFYLTIPGVSKVNRGDRLTTFKTEIQRALRDVGASGFAQITNSYGPTVVVNYRKHGLSFSVDMVYGLEVGDKIFVAKPSHEASSSDTNLWYKTFVLLEKDRMRTIDFNNGIGKMVIRRLKKLKDVEPALKVINSYAFEQALMYLKDDHHDALFWRENNMKDILKTILLFMENALRKGNLPAYFDKHNNAIGGLTTEQKIQLANRFNRLAANPDIVLKKTD